MDPDLQLDLLAGAIDHSVRRRMPSIDPLLVPNAFEDFRCPIHSFDNLEVAPEPRPRQLFEAASIEGLVRNDDRDCSTGRLIDADGHALEMLIKGKAAPLIHYLLDPERTQFWISGVLERRRGRVILTYPEPVDEEDLAPVRPVYPVPHQTITSINAELEGEKSSYLASLLAQTHVRRTIRETWGTRQGAAAAAMKKKALKNRKGRDAAFIDYGFTAIRDQREKFLEILESVHFPTDLEHCQKAHESLQYISAVSILNDSIDRDARSIKAREKKLGELGVPVLDRKLFGKSASGALRRLCKHLPFTLTSDQKKATREILADLLSGRPMHRFLSGDVGTGKTYVYGIAARAAALSGLHVAILLPSTTLAEQIEKNIRMMNPDIGISYVTSSRVHRDPDSRIWIGTLAVQHVHPESFDLVIVDEQQKWGREQREQLRHARSHLLEVTATCIPRSQALLLLNEIQISRVMTCHVKKKIRCQLFDAPSVETAINRARQTVEAGGQVAVVYPAKRASEYMVAVGDDRVAWNEAFPGRVVEVHNGVGLDDASASVESVKQGQADILLATTKIEVGIDLHGLTHVIVMEPARFGLSTLHQIRGRVARGGGEGYCDLVARSPLTAGATARLDYFCRTPDGFSIAHYDMLRRGSGDMSSMGHRQSGSALNNPFPGFEVPHEALMRASLVLRKFYGLRDNLDLEEILGSDGGTTDELLSCSNMDAQTMASNAESIAQEILSAA